jgi:hypothetical protein
MDWYWYPIATRAKVKTIKARAAFGKGGTFVSYPVQAIIPIHPWRAGPRHGWAISR